VISEANILRHRDGQVTFRYSDSQAGEQRTRTLPGEHFLWLLLTACAAGRLPSGA